MGNVITWNELQAAATEPDIQILYRDGWGNLWGIPYDLKSGEQPMYIQDRSSWTLLDNTDPIIADFLSRYSRDVPTQVNAWTYLPEN